MGVAALIDVRRAVATGAAAAAALLVAPACANDRDILDVHAAMAGGNWRLAGEVINVGMAHDEPKAYFFAGYLYDITGCVDDDPVRAERYDRKAAEPGDPDAPQFIGLLHRLGRGVPQDDAIAYDWYIKRRQVETPLQPLDEEAAQVAGYPMTVALLARQYALYPDDARRDAIQSTLEVVFDPLTRQVEVRDHVATLAVGSHVVKKDSFVTNVKAAYQTGIALAPPLLAEASKPMRFATPWRFGKPRDGIDDSFRAKGPITTDDTYLLPNP